MKNTNTTLDLKTRFAILGYSLVFTVVVGGSFALISLIANF